MSRWWHRIRRGHTYRAWPIYLSDDETPAWACRTCLMDATRDDARPQGKAF